MMQPVEVEVDSETKITIYDKLHKRIQRVTKQKEKGCHGFMLGRYSDNTFNILTGVASRNVSLNHLKSCGIVASTAIPDGMQFCGFFMQSGQASFPAIMKTLLQKILPPQIKELLGQKFLVWIFDEADKEFVSSIYWYDIIGGNLTKMKFEVSHENPLEKSMLFRMQGALPIEFEFTSREEQLKSRLASAMQLIVDKVQSDVTVFRVKDSNVILGDDQGMTCQQLLQHIYVEGEDERDRKRRTADPAGSVVNVEWLCQTTGDNAISQTIGGTPVLRHDHVSLSQVTIHLPLDVLVPVDPNMDSSELRELLMEGTSKLLYQMRQNILDNVQHSTFYTPRVYHFQPKELGHFVTVVYAEGAEQSKLANARQELNARFLLTEKKPVFKPSQCYTFPDDKSSTRYLLNTHVGLPPSGVKGGQQYIVDGTYAYHHYMQDKMDDNGWGCAYRSLQTIVSWFRHQGYTDKPIPTHKEIQKILVDIGDKPEAFIGSRKWIGSTEVSFVLDTLLGVTSRILPVTNGAELGSKGRELANHFETQGTPIMIGGGVLAHTILGVDFNEVTGDLKFLILDPHYTGAEDLKTIQDKGWCGWKGPDFWDQTAFYNLCMPQRPESV